MTAQETRGPVAGGQRQSARRKGLGNDRGERTTGTMYGVGMGPGDPELVTLKARRVLEEAALICVPKGREDGESYVLGLLSRLIDLRGRRVEEMVFPMTKDRAVLARHWDAAVERLLAPLRDGQDVAFATEGDPYIYSTFMHLHSLFRTRHPEVHVEVVPGVSSINASAAAAGLPLVDGSERLAVLPAVYEGEDLSEVLERFDTVVLMKVNRVLDTVLGQLEAAGLVDGAVYVSRCGTPRQEIIRNVRSLRGRELDYLSLLIVKRGRGRRGGGE